MKMEFFHYLLMISRTFFQIKAKDNDKESGRKDILRSPLPLMKANDVIIESVKEFKE